MYRPAFPRCKSVQQAGTGAQATHCIANILVKGVSCCRYEAEKGPAGHRLAACIMEPLLQGACGMTLVDPLFQVCLRHIHPFAGTSHLYSRVTLEVPG